MACSSEAGRGPGRLIIDTPGLGPPPPGRPWVLLHAGHQVGVAGFRIGFAEDGLEQAELSFPAEVAGPGALQPNFRAAALNHAPPCCAEGQLFCLHRLREQRCPSIRAFWKKAGFVEERGPRAETDGLPCGVTGGSSSAPAGQAPGPPGAARPRRAPKASSLDRASKSLRPAPQPPSATGSLTDRPGSRHGRRSTSFRTAPRRVICPWRIAQSSSDPAVHEPAQRGSARRRTQAELARSPAGRPAL